jgi:ComF family protein
MNLHAVKQKNKPRTLCKLLANTFGNAIFPPRCAGCRIWNEDIFCIKCQKHLDLISKPLCYCCGKPFDAAAQVLPQSVCADCRPNRYHGAPPLTIRRAPMEFSEPVRHAVYALKYQGKTALAGPLAALLWEKAGVDAVPEIWADTQLLVPVPLHPYRQWRRGYNQSELLAKELSHLSGRPIAQLLQRSRYTRPQIELGDKERAQNVKGAFNLHEGNWKRYNTAKKVLLIDDVATTGATLNECARVLKAAGVENVYALTLARRD